MLVTGGKPKYGGWQQSSHSEHVFDVIEYIKYRCSRDGGRT